MDGVAVFIRNDNRYLMVEDARGPFEGKWAPVHGTLQEGETPEEAAKREAKEEVNLDIELEAEITTTPADYKTEELHWYLAESTETDVSIDKREIADYDWFSYRDMRELELLPQAKKVIHDYGSRLK